MFNSNFNMKFHLTNFIVFLKTLNQIFLYFIITFLNAYENIIN